MPHGVPIDHANVGDACLLGTVRHPTSAAEHRRTDNAPQAPEATAEAVPATAGGTNGGSFCSSYPLGRGRDASRVRQGINHRERPQREGRT